MRDDEVVDRWPCCFFPLICYILVWNSQWCSWAQSITEIHCLHYFLRRGRLLFSPRSHVSRAAQSHRSSCEVIPFQLRSHVSRAAQSHQSSCAVSSAVLRSHTRALHYLIQLVHPDQRRRCCVVKEGSALPPPGAIVQAVFYCPAGLTSQVRLKGRRPPASTRQTPAFPSLLFVMFVVCTCMGLCTLLWMTVISALHVNVNGRPIWMDVSGLVHFPQDKLK